MHEKNERYGVIAIICGAVGLMMIIAALLKKDKNIQGEK